MLSVPNFDWFGWNVEVVWWALLRLIWRNPIQPTRERVVPIVQNVASLFWKQCNLKALQWNVGFHVVGRGIPTVGDIRNGKLLLPLQLYQFFRYGKFRLVRRMKCSHYSICVTENPFNFVSAMLLPFQSVAGPQFKFESVQMNWWTLLCGLAQYFEELRYSQRTLGWME